MLAFPASAFRKGKPVAPAPQDADGVRPPPTTESLPFDRFCDDEALAGAWQRLEGAASLPTQSHAFALALSGTLLTGTEISVLTVRDSEDITALLPLWREASPVARWRMLGADAVDEPGDALCKDPEAARLLAAAIARDDLPLRMDRIPARSPLITALKAAMRGRGWLSVRPGNPMPFIALDSSWIDPSSRFNARRRSDFRRAARRAAEFGQVSFELLAPTPGEFDVLFDEAIGVEARSWKREAGTAIALDRIKESCFRRFFRSGCERGIFRIAFMRIDGRPVAMQMALEWLDRYWLFKIGFDEDFARCSPGTLLMLHSIGWAASRKLGGYELLGQVEPWIAQLWTQEQNGCVCLRTYPFNARGVAAFAVDTGAWLRRRLPLRGS